MGLKHEQAAILVETLASAPIIYGAYYRTSGRLYAFLSLPFTRFLGRVSYSFYMVSTACIYVAARMVPLMIGSAFAVKYGLATNVFVTLLAYTLGLGVAALSYTWIEAPLMSMGKKLGLRFEVWINGQCVRDDATRAVFAARIAVRREKQGERTLDGERCREGVA